MSSALVLPLNRQIYSTKSTILYALHLRKSSTVSFVRRKRNHYSDLSSTVIFETVAMETLGGAGRSSSVFLKELARRITVLIGEKLAFIFLKQELDLAIQRGNAGCILEVTS